MRHLQGIRCVVQEDGMPMGHLWVRTGPVLIQHQFPIRALKLGLNFFNMKEGFWKFCSEVIHEGRFNKCNNLYSIKHDKISKNGAGRELGARQIYTMLVSWKQQGAREAAE